MPPLHGCAMIDDYIQLVLFYEVIACAVNTNCQIMRIGVVVGCRIVFIRRVNWQ